MANGDNTTEVSNSKRPKKTKLQNFTEFLYHRETGKFLGRTAGSWGKSDELFCLTL